MGFLKNLLGSTAGEMVPPSPRAGYMNSRGASASFMSKWRPSLRSAKTDVAVAWDAAAGRANDLVQNSGWIAGMFDQCVANVVGTGLRLKCAPENDLFGMSEKDAREWRKLVERRFQLWARSPIECDIEGRRTFGMMQDAAFRSFLITGEIVSESLLRSRVKARLKTKVKLHPPMMIPNRTLKHQRIFSGVKIDADGRAIAYLKKGDEFGFGHDAKLVPANDRYGRPRVIHNFHGPIGAVRGVSPIVPVLRVAKQFDQLADSTLMGSLLQTVFAANLKSPELTKEAMAGLMTPQEQSKMAAEGTPAIDHWFATQDAWYQENKIDVGDNARLIHTFPGQEFEFLSPDLPQSAYKEFSKTLLMEMARCLGMTYESATGDYEGASYATIRAAVSEIFPITRQRREFVVAPFCQAHYEAWLEEEIQRGDIPFPGGLEGFLRHRAAACRAEWKGSPKPESEILKTAKAFDVFDKLGVVTKDDIAGAIGDRDYEDVLVERSQEADLRKQYINEVEENPDGGRSVRTGGAPDQGEG